MIGFVMDIMYRKTIKEVTSLGIRGFFISSVMLGSLQDTSAASMLAKLGITDIA